MGKNNEFSKEDIYGAIDSLTAEEKEKLANEYKNTIKNAGWISTLCMVFGTISLLVSVITLIASAALKYYDTMELALILFVAAGVLLCIAIYFKSKVKSLNKSIDDVLYDFIVTGLNNKSKWYVDRMKQIKERIAVPYSEFHVDKSIEIRPLQFEYLLVDGVHEEFIIKRSLKYSRRYSFREVLNYSNLENGVSASENAATGAMIGGLFGARGAIDGVLLGASETVSSMKIVIYIKDLTEPQITLELLSGSIHKVSEKYRSAQRRMIEITSVLQYILSKRTDY